jgi:hypothetical protein
MNGTSIRTTLLICFVFAASVTIASAATGTYAPSTTLSDRLGCSTLAPTVAVVPGNLATFEPMYTFKPINQFPVRQPIRQLARKASTSNKASNIGAQGQAPTGGATDGGGSPAQGPVRRIINIRGNAADSTVFIGGTGTPGTVQGPIQSK